MEEKRRSFGEWAKEWYKAQYRYEFLGSMKDIRNAVLARVSVIKGLAGNDTGAAYAIRMDAQMTETELLKMAESAYGPVQSMEDKYLESYAKFLEYESKIRGRNSLPEDEKARRIERKQAKLNELKQAYYRTLNKMYEAPNGEADKFGNLTEEEEKLCEFLLEKIPSKGIIQARKGIWEFLGFDERQKLLELYFGAAEDNEYLLMDADAYEIQYRILCPSIWRIRHEIQNIEIILETVEEDLSIRDLNEDAAKKKDMDTVLQKLKQIVKILDKYRPADEEISKGDSLEDLEEFIIKHIAD